jgi:hypothetical protein
MKPPVEVADALEHPLGEPAELPGPKVRLLDVQAHDLFLDMSGVLSQAQRERRKGCGFNRPWWNNQRS